ncbi:MAG: galactose mutarotase, partial [Candidatus Hydrogenedentes bacterium]|nr:galactose mutarotase [Candidatus Hydrogenedentota bacterium]
MTAASLRLAASFLCVVALASCATTGTPGTTASEENTMSIATRPFGQTPAGEEVSLYTLTNANGMEVSITNFGAIVQSIKVPDRDGKMGDVVLGFDELQGYVDKHPYFGAIVGRYGNRIAKGKFTLDGAEYTLAINNDQNALHGGLVGFDKKVWAATPVEDADSVGLSLQLVSPDGDEGYPGTLTTAVNYRLTNDNALEIHYLATTDAPTVLNLTNHSYFNLDGAGSGDILDQVVMINADRFTPVDATLIPTGELRPVEGTPFDFRTAKPLGQDIAAADEQITLGGGYDHNFVLNQQTSGAITLAARVLGPESGRVMEVYTTEPGLQFYSGNFLDGTNTGKGGVVYEHRYGFCMETQHFPDSPNQPAFPSVVLRP